MATGIVPESTASLERQARDERHLIHRYKASTKSVVTHCPNELRFQTRAIVASLLFEWKVEPPLYDAQHQPICE